MLFVVDFIYKEFILDVSIVCYFFIMERFRFIFLGEKGLLVDLRYFNIGRLIGWYDIFFEYLCFVVEEIIVVDERRYNIVYLFEWLLFGEFVEKTKEKCLVGIFIFFKSFVRL